MCCLISHSQVFENRNKFAYLVAEDEVESEGQDDQEWIFGNGMIKITWRNFNFIFVIFIFLPPLPLSPPSKPPPDH